MIRKVARAIILNKNNEFLVAKRMRGNGTGQWALVGGKPETGEDESECIKREVGEELGLVFKNPKFWKKELDVTSIPGERWSVFYFYGPAKGKLKIKKDEVSDVKYFDKTQINDLDLAFNHKQILKKFFDSLE